MSKQKNFTRQVARTMAALMMLTVFMSNPLLVRANTVLSNWISSSEMRVGDSLYWWGIQPIWINSQQYSSNIGTTSTIARITTNNPHVSHIVRSDDLVNWHIIAPNASQSHWEFFNGYYFSIYSDLMSEQIRRYIVRSDFAGNTYTLLVPDTLTGFPSLSLHSDFLIFGSTTSPDNVVLKSTDGINWNETVAGTIALNSVWEPSRIVGDSWPGYEYRIEELTQRHQGVDRRIGFGTWVHTSEGNNWTSEANIITNRINVYYNGQLINSLTANNEALRVSNWAIDSIERAYGLGLNPGQISTFTNESSRQQFAAFAVHLYELVRGEIAGRVTFTDTNNVNVQKAAYIGVVSGMGDGTFSPWNEITREQAAVMLVNLANALGLNLPSAPTTFADNGNISGWAMDAVERVNAAGIMVGVSDTRFNPQGNFTGEQTVITMLLLFEMLQNHQPSYVYVLSQQHEINQETTTIANRGVEWQNQLHSLLEQRDFFAHVRSLVIVPPDEIVPIRLTDTTFFTQEELFQMAVHAPTVEQTAPAHPHPNRAMTQTEVDAWVADFWELGLNNWEILMVAEFNRVRSTYYNLPELPICPYLVLASRLTSQLLEEGRAADGPFRGAEAWNPYSSHFVAFYGNYNERVNLFGFNRGGGNPVVWRGSHLRNVSPFANIEGLRRSLGSHNETFITTDAVIAVGFGDAGGERYTTAIILR